MDQSPIEGFVLFYKPFQSTKEFKVERLLGPNLRLHELTGLEPDTQYTLKLQCFNLAGNSDFSNQVVKKTLGTLIPHVGGGSTPFPQPKIGNQYYT